MKKIIEVETLTRTIRKAAVHCDDCGKIMDVLVKCTACGADLCEDCISREDVTGRERIILCSGCSMLIRDNNKDVLELRKQADLREEELYWFCKQERNKKIDEQMAKERQSK